MLISNLRAQEFYVRMSRLGYIQKQLLRKKTKENQDKPLQVVYLLGHVSVCGGVKIILEHANELIKCGAEVTLLSHFPKPEWFEIQAIYFQVPFGIELARGIPSDCDVIVATYWDQLSACVESGIAPVVYFEQGDFHLWDWESVTDQKKKEIYALYQLPSYITTCSATGARKIREVFQRDATVFPNALNDQVFFPKDTGIEGTDILGVGGEQATFKRIPDIWQACQLVQSKGFNITFTWVTQNTPSKPLGHVVVSPPQPALGDIYRQARIYVCASEYETFPLPPLEAMACGTPVITTPNAGVLAYGVDQENCLFFLPGDTHDLAEKIMTLLQDPILYRKLQENGYHTARRFKWSQIIPQLKNYYEEVAQYEPVPKNDLTHWVKLIPEEFSLEEQQAIDQFLGNTAADLVYLPFQFHMSDQLTVARWVPAFQKKLPNSGQVDRLTCVWKERHIGEYPYRDAVVNVLAGHYAEAIGQFKQKIEETTNPQEVAVLLRWVAWCLLCLQRYQEAQVILQKGHKAYPLYTDIYYLYSILFQHVGSVLEQQAVDETIKVMGEAVAFPEFIRIKSD